MSKNPLDLSLHKYSLLLLLLIVSCNAVNTVSPPNATTPEIKIVDKSNQQIAQYIRNIYEDKNGHLWMGTNGSGIAHYNGDSLSYYSIAKGFDGR